MRHRSKIVSPKPVAHFFFDVCIAKITKFYSHLAQEACLGYWELIRPFESICPLCCHRSFIMHRYVLSVCSPACFGSPRLGGKARLAGALCSKQCIAWPRPAHRSMFQQTSGDAHAHAHSCTVNTALSCPQAQHSAALIEFQTQSMLQGNCIVNQCLSKPRQWSGLHSLFLQIGYEGYTVV